MSYRGHPLAGAPHDDGLSLIAIGTVSSCGTAALTHAQFTIDSTQSPLFWRVGIQPRALVSPRVSLYAQQPAPLTRRTHGV